MIIYLAASATIFIVGHLAGVSIDAIREPLLTLAAERRQVLIGGSLFGVIGLVVTAVLLGRLGLFNLMFSLVKAFSETVRFFLCLLALTTMIFWWQSGTELWREGGGALIIACYLWFYGSIAGLRLFDFNYPVGTTLLRYSSLPFICLILVMAGGILH